MTTQVHARRHATRSREGRFKSPSDTSRRGQTPWSACFSDRRRTVRVAICPRVVIAPRQRRRPSRSGAARFSAVDQKLAEGDHLLLTAEVVIHELPLGRAPTFPERSQRPPRAGRMITARCRRGSCWRCRRCRPSARAAQGCSRRWSPCATARREPSWWWWPPAIHAVTCWRSPGRRTSCGATRRAGSNRRTAD